MQNVNRANCCFHDLTTHWITNKTDFLALKNEWNTLANQVSDEFFFRHEWFESALAWREHDAQLAIYCAYHQTKLIALLPLCISKSHYKGLPFKQAEFLSVPDTQVCDFMVLPSYRHLAQAILISSLHCKDWDKLRLHYLAEDSLIGSIYRDGIPHASLLETTQHAKVLIEHSFEAYYQTRSRRLKKGNNLCRNHLLKAGAVSIKDISSFPVKDILNTIKHISEHSWKKATKTTFDQAGPSAFIHHLTQIAQDNHWLSVWVLTLDNENIAYEYQISFLDKVHALRSDYLQAKQALSPGTYLNWQVLAKIFEQGKSIYCMGPGNNAYKKRWQNKIEPVYTFCHYSATLTGRILKTCEQNLAPKIRPIRHQLESWLQKEPNQETIT